MHANKNTRKAFHYFTSDVPRGAVPLPDKNVHVKRSIPADAKEKALAAVRSGTSVRAAAEQNGFSRGGLERYLKQINASPSRNKGGQFKLTDEQLEIAVHLVFSRGYSSREVGRLFQVSNATICRGLDKLGEGSVFYVRKLLLAN